MAVTSIRLNPKEERLVNFLKDYYELDTSTLLKKSLLEMYEDVVDKKIIDDYENKGKQEFMSYEDLIE